LIIDDEEPIRTLVAATLESEGHTTQSAESAEEGLTALKEFHPDVIISDIRMDGMSGFEFLEEVRKDPATADIPFIFITGVGGKENYRHGMELGADDFLEKPFTKGQLVASVKARLRLKQIQRELGEKKLQDLRSSISQALPHEFRTPLNAVLAFSKILRDDDEITPEEIRKFSGMIHSAGEKLHRLVENYLLYAQVEVAAADERVHAELRQAVTERAEKVIGSSAHDIAEEYGRAKECVVRLQPVNCRIAHDHLAKIVRELIDNAMKFSSPGTPVAIDGAKEGDKYRLRVSDKGTGMAPDQIRNIDVFQQFDRKKLEQKGAGFGLGIVKRLTEIYGGALTVESSPGKGTTANLTLIIASEG
jgi:signal transduction histidine kinase